MYCFALISPFVRDSKPGNKPGSARARKSIQLSQSSSPQCPACGRTLDHVRHQRLGIASDGKEFELALYCFASWTSAALESGASLFQNEGLENVVCCDSDSMPVIENEAQSGRDVWLNVTWSPKSKH